MEIGCIIALALVYYGFEYTSEEVRTAVLDENTVITEIEDLIPITFETPPPPPAAPKIPVLSDQIDIVDDDIEIDDNMFLKLEDDPGSGVEIMDYIEVIDEEVEEEEIPFMLVEEKPTFQKGDANDFSKWVNQRLVYPEIAKENGVQLQIAIDPRWTSTDADDLSLVRNGVPTVLLSLPIKYMHTNVETFDMHALMEGGRLLAHYLSDMDASWEEELWN